MPEEVFDELKSAITNFDVDKVVEAAKKSVSLDIDPLEAIERGLSSGLREVGERFEDGELFLIHIVAAAEAAQKAMKEVFEPQLLKQKKTRKSLGKVVIGTVKGDIHDIGKTIVASMLSASGFDVYDIGKDVPSEEFVERAKEMDANIVAASALLSTALPVQREIVEALRKAGMREKVKVMVGGGPVTQEWAEEIGADGYGSNAVEAVKVAKRLLMISE
ncbi:MAG: B12-binding domain-containing protein [Candidatus Geothermarchaeales archaeon]